MSANKIDEKTLALDMEQFEKMGLRVYFETIIGNWLKVNQRGCEELTEPHGIYRFQGMVASERKTLELLRDPLRFWKIYKDQSADKPKSGSGD